MPNVPVNYGAVLVAVFINLVIGVLWCSPLLFGRELPSLMGRKRSELANIAGEIYAVAAVGSLVEVWILAHFVRWAVATTLLQGAALGFLIWAGFLVIPATISAVMHGSRKKLLAATTGYFFVIMVVDGAILAVWR